MKRKRHPDRFNPDKYKDGPKKPASSKLSKFEDDDDYLDKAFDEWKAMKSWQSDPDGDDDDWEEEE